MNRRELLKASAMAAAAAAAARLAGRELDAAPIADGITWDKAPCRFCGTGCHVQVGVKDRKIVAIAGDQKADVNKGLLCVKGYHVALAIYGKDRLTTPLLRRTASSSRSAGTRRST
jgi:nitrate reductase NapA